MRRLIKCLTIMIVLFLFSLSLFTKATVNNLNIDTRNKKAALSSIVKIFTGWVTNSPAQYNIIHEEEAYKLYLLINDLNSSNMWTQAQIINAITNRGLTYSLLYFETYLYDSVTIEKKYVYDCTRYDYRLDDDLENFSSSLVSYHTNYLGSQAFYGGYEQFNFVITTTYTTPSGGGFILDGINEPQVIGNETIVNNLYFGTFKRYFENDQTTYGFDSSYRSSYSFIYPESIVNYQMNVQIIDNDKIIINGFDSSNYFSIYMTKEQHHSRNENQAGKHTLNDIVGNFNSTYIAYFHQLGLFNGDQSNYSNMKKFKTLDSVENDSLYYYYPYASYEYTYNSSNTAIITNALIVGTFNFVDPSISNTMHWAYDVIPYLIWGNNEFDDSTVAERFAWDKGSFLYAYRAQRGETLIAHGSRIESDLEEVINQLS